jgi:single-strand DNA-binding protein
MAGVNKWIGVGNLGRDPEVRFTQGGSAVCNLSVAVGERVKKGETWEEHTEWVRVVCFGKTAENAGQFLQKGRQVYVEGRLRQREYEKDGVKQRSTEVVADVLQFLGGKGETGGNAKPAAPAQAIDADDLPF